MNIIEKIRKKLVIFRMYGIILLELQEEWDIPLFHVDGGIYGYYKESGSIGTK